MDSETLRIGRDRLSRVFQYLEALNQHRNPATRQIREQPWSFWLRDLPNHPAIELWKPGEASESLDETAPDKPSVDERSDNECILRVRRPNLTRAPDPPEGVRPWLKSGWDSPMQDVSHHESVEEIGQDSKPQTVRFEDDPNRITAFDEWLARRDQWAESEKPARQAMKIFERLYELYGQMEREAERFEIVLGDGILSWRRQDGGVYHPVVLQRLNLDFDPNIPEFSLTETERPVELYTALFQSMSDVDGRSIGRCREELEEGGYHPLGFDDTTGFLRRLVVQLSPRGEFVEGGAPKGETDDPQIGRDPVLFLRARTLGFASAIEAILADLQDREDLPWSLLNIVGVEVPTTEQAEADTAPSGSDWETDESVLLSKPANLEQVRIARQVETHGGVLVQGPPGTGKTHTIGNLIGHLLAQGKSVLVTSHTTKALKMVREHVVKELRPLCVSVLENDLEGREQLKAAVGSIADRLSRSDAKKLGMEASVIERRRHRLIEKLKETQQQLANARTDEYRDIVVGGQPWPPSQAARLVARGKEADSWIPGPVSLGSILPISEAQVAELYQSNAVVTAEDESELRRSLPAVGELMEPEEFRSLVAERKRPSVRNLNLREDLWQSGQVPGTPEELAELADGLKRAVADFSHEEGWKLSAASAGMNGELHTESWSQLISSTEDLHERAARSQDSLLKYGPRFSEQIPLEQQIQVCKEVTSHLEAGGGLGFFPLLTHGSWKAFLQQARVDGKEPTLPEHFRALEQALSLTQLRNQLAGRWDRQMAQRGAPNSSQIGEPIEGTLIQFCDPIRECLGWHKKTWTPLLAKLKRFGFDWERFLKDQPPVIGANGALQRLANAVKALLPILDSRADFLRWQRSEEKLKSLRTVTDGDGRASCGSPALVALRAAVAGESIEDYRAAFGRLVDLNSKGSLYHRRHELIERLEKTAPDWGSAIQARVAIHGKGDLPGNAKSAWIWRQLNDELDRRASVSLEDLQKAIEDLRDQLRHVTVQLVDCRAWEYQTQRTSLRQRQALIGWLDIVRKIGKGKGKRAPFFRAQAAKKMAQCRDAVPVWIMPLSRVVENFDPRNARFDVVIVDEASQSDVMALVALYLGKTVVVVGDNEQVSPSAVGQQLDVIGKLIRQYLEGIPNSELYDGQMSVYDLAHQSFGGIICLLEHFRCVPDIIQFSNHLSYQGRIKPLRDPTRVKLKPHTVEYRVSDASRDGKVNRREALAVASLIAAVLDQPEYRTNEAGQPLSVGAVSLLGEEQVFEIDSLVHEHIPEVERRKHRLLCGTAAQFQGDERDIMFLSLVDVAEDGPLPLRETQQFKQRFNVAASRARDQMWVVHSLNPSTDLKKNDLRLRLIEHVKNPHELTRLLEEKSKRAESEFEKRVLEHLLSQHYRVTPQWHVGAYRIDLVVEGEGARLAIECDGDRYHPLDKLPEDMERQAVLERLGWTFVRIRGSVFFRDENKAMKPVLDRLHSLGIEPGIAPTSESAPSNELLERVARRAEELRHSWEQETEIAAQDDEWTERTLRPSRRAEWRRQPITEADRGST